MLLSSFRIIGHSMEPTITSNTHILVSSLPYFFSNPKIGDIVAFKILGKKKIFIKRINKIQKNKYKILGDNPQDSLDSRTFGWIRKKDIIGKIIYYHKSVAKSANIKR